MDDAEKRARRIELSLREKFRRQRMYINEFDERALIKAIAQTIEEETRPVPKPRSISDLVIDSLRGGPKRAGQIVQEVTVARRVQTPTIYRTLNRLSSKGKIFKSGAQGDFTYSLQQEGE